MSCTPFSGNSPLPVTAYAAAMKPVLLLAAGAIVGVSAAAGLSWAWLLRVNRELW